MVIDLVLRCAFELADSLAFWTSSGTAVGSAELCGSDAGKKLVAGGTAIDIGLCGFTLPSIRLFDEPGPCRLGGERESTTSS